MRLKNCDKGDGHRAFPQLYVAENYIGYYVSCESFSFTSFPHVCTLARLFRFFIKTSRKQKLYICMINTENSSRHLIRNLTDFHLIKKVFTRNVLRFNKFLLHLYNYTLWSFHLDWSKWLRNWNFICQWSAQPFNHTHFR